MVRLAVYWDKRGSNPAIDDYARIAQMVEHGPAEPRVPGSNPGTSFFCF